LVQCTAKLASKLEWNVVDDLMFIEATAMTPGTFQGIDGQKVHWTAPVISEATPTGKQKPILFVHTDEEGDEKESVVGFVQDVQDEDGRVRFKGIVYNDIAYPFIESGELDSISPEIDFQGDFNSEMGAYLATKAKFSSFVLTNIPANEEAKIEKHGFIHISLERKGKMEIQETAWKDLSDEQRLNLMRTFIKDKKVPVADLGVEIPEKTDDKTDNDVDKPSPEVEELKNKLTEQANQIAYFQEKELAQLEGEINVIDDEFKREEFLEGVEGFTNKKVKLERHLRDLNRLIPKIKLNLGTDKAKLEKKDEEMKKAVLEQLGDDAKKYYPELFPNEKEGDK